MSAPPPPASLIALYHAVGTPAATGYRDAVTGAVLQGQLEWLLSHYRVRPLDELVSRRRAGESLDGLAAITFDDNHPSLLAEALPLLSRLGLPATWFLIAAPLRGVPFWRQQVRSLERGGQVEAFLAFARGREPAAARLRAERFYRDSKDPSRIDSIRMMALLDAYPGLAGLPAEGVSAAALAAGLPPAVQLGNHSDRHPVFAGLPEAAQRAEIRRGRAGLEALGQPLSAAFALPFGGAGSWDGTTLAAAAAEGVAALLTTVEGLGAAVPADAGTSRPPILQRSLLGRALAG